MSSISIIVCCYNSADRLRETLKHLALQKISKDINCEIIVVDNNSSDNTSDEAEAEWKKNGSPYPLTTITEPKPGLSNARKTGVLAAKYDYICFCDDDNWLCESYIQTALEIMASNANIGVLAGQGVAVSDVEIPNWFYSYYRSYACGVLDLESGDVTNRHYVWGAGMVLRKYVLINLYNAGFCHLTLDREGEKLTSGGDNEICYWHILVGYKLWFEEKLSFKHFMPVGRLTKEYFNSLEAGKRESTSALLVYRNLLVTLNQNKTLKGFIKALILYLLNEKGSANITLYLPWLLSQREKNAVKNLKQNIIKFREISERL